MDHDQVDEGLLKEGLVKDDEAHWLTIYLSQMALPSLKFSKKIVTSTCPAMTKLV